MTLPDLAPGAPSRILRIDAVQLGEDAPKTGSVAFSLLSDLRVLSSGQIIAAGTVVVDLVDGKGQIRVPTMSTLVTDDCGDDWVIIVKKSWAAQAYAIQVPAGTSDLQLGDLAPARPLTRRELQWAVTAASLSVETLPPGSNASGTVSLSGGTLGFRLRVPRGEQGLPGPGALAADTAVAAYVESDSATSAALDKVYRRGYSPREWGVVGNGVADDTAAWNALLAAVPAGAVVTCPEGDRYKLTGPITPARSVTVQGGTWLAHSTGTMWDVKVDGVTLRNQRWEAAKGSAESTHRGLYAIGTSAVPVKRLRLDSIISDGFKYESMRTLWCRDVQITDCEIRDPWYAGIMILSSTHGRISRTSVTNVLRSTTEAVAQDAYGIAISDNTNDIAGRSRDWVVDGCRVENVDWWEGIDTHSGLNVTITNNTVINCRTGIAVLAGNTSRVVAPEQCVVANNVIISGSSHEGVNAIQFLGVLDGAQATGTIGPNVVMGYTRDTYTVYNSPSLTTVLAQATDATDRWSPPPPQWREWNAISTVTVTNGSGVASPRFPTGMFTQPPLVQATKQTGAAARYVPYIANVTAEGCDVGLHDPTGAAQSALAVPVAIRVTQARRNTAAGTSGT